MHTPHHRPLVSVIIPTHNRAALLGRAIKSVLSQTVADLELIVVDDASDDGTDTAVGLFTDPRLVCIKHDSNRGGSAARNTGIRSAKGAYVAFLDSDDEWLPHKLERQLAEFRQSPAEVGCVCCSYTPMLNGKRCQYPTPASVEGDLHEALLAANCVGTTSTVLIRSQLLHAAGGFDERLPACQDWDMWIRLSRLCHFRFVPESLVLYHIHGSNISFQHPNLIAGTKLLHNKLRAELDVRPRVHAQYHYRLAVLHLLSGHDHIARSHFLLAISLNRTRATYYVHYLVAVLGANAYLGILRLKAKARDMTAAAAS